MTMKHSFATFLSLVVLSETLGVLAKDAVDCYAIDAVNEITLTFNTLNLCASQCEEAGYSVFAAQGPRCSCTDTLPSNDKKRDASQCNVPCPGYALENCGGVARNYSVGTIEGLGIDSFSTASLSVSTTGTATATIVSGGSASVTFSQNTPGTATAGPSSMPLNNTAVATPSTTSGSSGSAPSTVESNSAGAIVFRMGVTAMVSVVPMVAALIALI